jgi:hypothetical protein
VEIASKNSVSVSFLIVNTGRVHFDRNVLHDKTGVEKPAGKPLKMRCDLTGLIER